MRIQKQREWDSMQEMGGKNKGDLGILNGLTAKVYSAKRKDEMKCGRV